MNKEKSFDDMFDSIFKTIDVEHKESPKLNDKDSNLFNELKQEHNKEGQ